MVSTANQMVVVASAPPMDPTSAQGVAESALWPCEIEYAAQHLCWHRVENWSWTIPPLLLQPLLSFLLSLRLRDTSGNEHNFCHFGNPEPSNTTHMAGTAQQSEGRSRTMETAMAVVNQEEPQELAKVVLTLVTRREAGSDQPVGKIWVPHSASALVPTFQQRRPVNKAETVFQHLH
jgi:hypothetical protein